MRVDYTVGMVVIRPQPAMTVTAIETKWSFRRAWRNSTTRYVLRTSWPLILFNSIIGGILGYLFL